MNSPKELIGEIKVTRKTKAEVFVTLFIAATSPYGAQILGFWLNHGAAHVAKSLVSTVVKAVL